MELTKEQKFSYFLSRRERGDIKKISKALNVSSQCISRIVCQHDPLNLKTANAMLNVCMNREENYIKISKLLKSITRKKIK